MLETQTKSLPIYFHLLIYVNFVKEDCHGGNSVRAVMVKVLTNGYLRCLVLLLVVLVVEQVLLFW